KVQGALCLSAGISTGGAGLMPLQEAVHLWETRAVQARKPDEESPGEPRTSGAEANARDDKPKPKRPSKNEERDEWLYDQVVEGVPLKSIIAELKNFKHWDPITREAGVSMAVRRFAERRGYDRPVHGSKDNQRLNKPPRS